MQVGETLSEKWKLSKGESPAFRSSENAKIFFLPSHSIESKNQQAEIKIDCRHLTKRFRKSILRKVFSNEWILKNPIVYEKVDSFQKKFWLFLGSKRRSFFFGKKLSNFRLAQQKRRERSIRWWKPQDFSFK